MAGDQHGPDRWEPPTGRVLFRSRVTGGLATLFSGQISLRLHLPMVA
ncbi:hypothetical protein JOF55_000155 [Haloactinomyces albus]|uniref:Uncharacterized protein n=1 Tax=Haloactinomyces albus TaxID=1352928 RepID=A0AAE3ZAL3_9ACTN|nr:hypothetical protein [Haloactinomyces albus]